MLARTVGAAVHGIDAIKVEIEVSVKWGVGFMIIGLPDTAVRESAERVRCAVQQSGYDFPGKQVMEEHIVDVSPWLDLTHVEVKELVGSKIVGGGGTELLPIVQHIQNTVGEDVSERFDVTIILTDAELCGNEMNWAESQQVFEVFGEHVSWIFLDLYNANYSAIQGEKKYLITCGSH